jgi:hypothetical protein
MKKNPLHLACIALATLVSHALPLAAEERPSVALVLIGPTNDNSWAEAAQRALEVGHEGQQNGVRGIGRRRGRRAGDARLCRPGF